MSGATHCAFLRAVNLGRARRVSSSELRQAFEELDLESVATFGSSGNVVFAAAQTPEERQVESIEQALLQRFGFAVPVYLRSAEELRALSAARPFGRAQRAEGGKLQVALLDRCPSPPVRADVLAHASDADRLAFGKRELLWLPSGGTRDSRLNLKAIEKLIGPWTMRTMRTIGQMAAKHFS
jgi:uncharacterized protein (DUF1697 family)